MSTRVDFFLGVKNLHPPNRAWKRYDRNYSGTGSDNDNIPGMHVRGNSNENVPVHRTSPWTHHNNLSKDEPRHEPITTAANFNNKSPNEQPPPPLSFAYNQVHPRTTAHLHRCHSCNYPVMVQVTADLYYHHVTFIPAAMARRNDEQYDAKNFVNESQHLSHGGRRTQEFSPVQELEEVSTLSNKPGDEEEEEEQTETAPSEKTQKVFRTYASITSGTIDSRADDNPLEETEETDETDDNAHQKVRLDQVGVVNDKTKENITASQVVVDNGGDGDDDASDDGFTTVVSWKSKIKAKAAAKAKEAAAHGYGYGYGYGRGRNRLGKHGRGSTREEHYKNVRMGPRDEQHDINDGGLRGDHDKRSRGGLIKDGHHKHVKGGPTHDKHGTRDQKEDGQDKHVRGFPRERNDKYGGFPRERNDKNRGFPREETGQQPKK